MGGGKSGMAETNQKEAKVEQKIRDEEANIRDMTSERMIAFDKDGNVLHVVDGNGTSADYDDKMRELISKGQVYAFTHNHPVTKLQGQEIEDTPFSPEDIFYMVEARNPVERVATKNKTYVLTRKESVGHSLFGDNKVGFTKSRSKFAEDYAKFMANAEGRAFSVTEGLCRSGRLPMTNEAYLKHATNLYVRMCEKWLSNHAKDYGYEYHEYRRKG